MNFFPKNLRHLRRKKGQNQSELSKLVNKKQNTIGNWENGISEPAIKELTMLTQYFGINLHDLVSIDLEAQDQLSGDQQSQPASSKQENRNYVFNEQASSMASEDSQNQFWVVVRELRRIHEKLDAIKGDLVSTKPTQERPPSSDSKF
jgi:transcriptional regulator with XRE-family HTH domain